MFNANQCPPAKTNGPGAAGAGAGKGFVTLETMNPNIKIMEYAVRGPLVIRAGEIDKELKQGAKKPFTEVIKANVGDAHAMGQTPITFIRQVIALVAYPPLMSCPNFPDDAKERACTIIKSCNGNSIGAYSDSCGIPVIRKHIAEYIQRRDGGVPANSDDVILVTGASGGIKMILELLTSHVGGKKPGLMVPIPQYPLYSATIAEFDMGQIGYYLNECNQWSLDVTELERAITEAKSKDIIPRAIVIINPGNPTGSVLTRENIENIIKFAHKERLMILSDEVYQDNIYAAGSKFYSMKKVVRELGPPYDSIELASFMSTSKGYMGECGLRGGYMEIINLDPAVKAMMLKCISASLCPTTLGQTAMDVVVNPPVEGEPSYEQFMKEKQHTLAYLAERAELIVDTFNSFEGFSCNKVQGAMYAFPRINLPKKAIEAAEKAGKKPDVFYAFELLENTGICIVAGSGFGQKPGSYHFRTTILPQMDKLKSMLEKFATFHKEFVAKYS